MNEENARINAALTAPFPADDIEWRVQRTGVGSRGPWLLCIPYVRVQAVEARLDEVFGPWGWENSFRYERFDILRAGNVEEAVQLKRHLDAGEIEKPHPEYVVICTIRARMEDGTWIAKEDGAEPSDFEPAKGALSVAEKRAGVQWGIGRYLRRIEETFGHIHGGGIFHVKIKGEDHKWSPPELPTWALPADQPPMTSTAQLRSQLEARTQPDPEPPAPVEPPKQVQPVTWDGGGRAPVVDWREVKVHFGKNKGKKLSELLPAAFKWYIESWHPKPYQGRISDTDTLLRDALDAAKAEWDDERSLDPEPAAEPEEAPPF